MNVLIVIGFAVVVFVGSNIGGSSTGVAFGPAVGSDVVSKTHAAGLMMIFALIGGLVSGPDVVRTVGTRIIPADQFTLLSSVVVLLFVGLALLLSNLFGVPASTSMTLVGAVAGLGVATGTTNWNTMAIIVSWWLFAPIVAFWTCAVIGRYFYSRLSALFPLDNTGNLQTTSDRLAASLVVVIGCFMAYSAGASNAANAVGPLYGSGHIGLFTGIVLAALAIGAGAFTIARRTLDTVGNDLTELPILAALVVEVVSATIIFLLSENGIPASLAVTATMSIVGLGWGRATRTTRVADAAEEALSGSVERSEISVDALAHDDCTEPTTASDTETTAVDDPPRQKELFQPAATGRIFVLWVATPTLAALASYSVFTLVY